MSEMTSKYELDLVLKDDQTRDTIQKLKKSLGSVSSGLNFADAQKEIERIADTLSSVALDTSEASDKILGQFSKDSRKSIGLLESQYIKLKERQESVKDEYEKLTEELKEQRKIYEDQNASELDKLNAANRIYQLSCQIDKHEFRELEAEIKTNQELRAKIKSLDNISKKTNLVAKQEEKYKEITNLKAKLEKAQNDNKLKFLKFITKADTDEIKLLKEKIRLLESEEKQEKKIGQAVKAVAKEQEKAATNKSKLLQNAYNAAGLVGGFAKTVKAAGSSAIGIIGQGVTAATNTANNNLDRERQAHRIKGMSPEEANQLLGKLYVRTGADYSQIVDAINRVKTTLKTASNDDVISAAELELRYPGMSAAFASTNTASNAGNFNIYANRMRAIQKATGVTDEQIQSSTQMFANMKPSEFGNAKVTELQAVYLGLQGSGAFESQEELDSAFERFVRNQRNSKENVAEAASKFKWSEGIRDGRNRLQASNTLGSMEWSKIIDLTKTKDSSEIQKTESEQLAEQMRELEMKKNDLIIKVLVPVANELLKVIDSPEGKKIIDGLVNFFTKAIPLLTDIIKWIKEKIEAGINGMENVFLAIDKQNEEQTRRQIDAASKGSTAGMIAYRGGADHFMANGGIAIGPSIVGERAFQPEMILPLDYSRSSRAGNIIQNVAQTFNMSGSETTALSLAQAVKSRDFRRATSQNAFITSRSGAF